MKLFLFAFVSTCLTSCFLFTAYKKDRISFNENGVEKKYRVVIPKGFKRKEKKTDSLGNQAQFYYYADGAVLYFADIKDTSVQYQQINYQIQMPLELYHALLYKGIDGTDNNYWRESRIRNYRAGYYKVDYNEDGKYDSAINYFTLRSVKPVQ